MELADRVRDDIIFTQEITQWVNDEREKLGRPPVTRRWVTEILREKDVRKTVGHAYLPCYTCKPIGGRPVYFGFKSELEPHIKAVAALDSEAGQEIGMKFRQHQRRLKQQAIISQGDDEHLRPDPQKMVNIRGVDAWTLVEQMRGYATCPICGGNAHAQCPYCINGLIPQGHPRYENDILVKVGDVVGLTVRIPGHEDCDQAMILSWSKDGTSLTGVLLRKQKPLRKAAEFHTHEVRFIRRRAD